jgi:hypothetical protein
VSHFFAERTPSHNPGIRHGPYRRRDIFTAFLAADGEVALPSLRKVEHEEQYRRTNGENATWISPDGERRWSQARYSIAIELEYLQ